MDKIIPYTSELLVSLVSFLVLFVALWKFAPLGTSVIVTA